GSGRKVKSRKQAIAIAMSESGQSRRRKPATRRTAARKTATRRTAARKTTGRRTATRRTATRKTAARRTPARKTTARRTTARKTPARKTTARRTAPRRTTTRRTTGRKTTARTTAARRTTGRKTTARRTTARQLRKSDAEALGRTVVVAARKCGRAGAQGRHDRALRQPPAFEQLAELRDARCKRGVVAAGGFGQRRMHIGERDAGAREISRGMRHDLAPCIVEWRHLAVDLPAPQERCRIGQIEQR